MTHIVGKGDDSWHGMGPCRSDGMCPSIVPKPRNRCDGRVPRLSSVKSRLNFDGMRVYPNKIQDPLCRDKSIREVDVEREVPHGS